MFGLRGTLVGFTLGIVFFAAQNALAFKIISYEGKSARWINKSASYVVDKRGSADFKNGCDGKGPCVSEFEAIRRSFDTWTQVSGTQISFQAKSPKVVERTGYNNENEIIWVERGWTSLSFAPPPGALAVTISTYRTSDNAILDSDIHFNGEYFTWGVVDTDEESTSFDVVDVQNIATHEIGHFVGLDHSSENIYEPDEKLYLATMFYASGPGETFRRELHEDDIAAMQNLYSTEDYGDPVVAELTPNRIDAYQGTAVVHISGRNFFPFTSVVIATDGDRGDVAGRITQISEDSIDVAFEVYSLPSGSYDVVVANTYEASERVRGALQIAGSDNEYDDSSGDGLASSSSGGCSISNHPSDSRAVFSAVFLLLLPLVLIGWSRFHLV